MKTNRKLFSLVLTAGIVTTLILAGCAPKDPGITLPEEPSHLKIEGEILSGGDQTPEGLLDAPRPFAYVVKLADNQEVTVTYTALPPSPAAQARPLTLEFNGGEIQIGEYMVAEGKYDPQTKTLTVAGPEDSIRTYAEKP